MLKKSIAVIVSLALIMSLTVSAPAFAKTTNGSSKKTVYAVSSWKTVTEYSDTSKKAAVSLAYTKKGLLKTIKTKDKKNCHPYLKGKPKYSYKGRRLIKVVRTDDGTYTTTFKYKKGKLKSATLKWKSKNPVATYYYVKNGKQAEKDIYDTHSRNYKLKLNSRGRVLHKKDVRYTDKGYPVFGSETLDEHGFPVNLEYTVTEENIEYLKSTSFGSSKIHAGDVFEQNAVNTYDKKGRLKKIEYTWTKNGKTRERTTITIKYKKIRIPSSYSKTFATQQYDILYFFADPFGSQSFVPESTPIGFGKVGK